MNLQSISLDTVQQHDRVLIHQLWSNANVRQYLGGIVQPMLIDDHFLKLLHNPTNDMHFIIRENEKGIGLITIDDYYEEGKKEISYQLLPEYWQKGIAAYCMRKVLTIVKDTYGLADIYAETQEKNTASRRLLEKLGFVPYATLVRYNEQQTVYRRKLK